jgi:hypothetical protein
MRHSGYRFSELIPAVPHSVWERSPHSSLPRNPRVKPGEGRVREETTVVRAVYLPAQRLDAIKIGGVKHPYAPCGVPYSAETAGSGREIRMVRTADRDAAVLLIDDRQRHSTYESD